MIDFGIKPPGFDQKLTPPLSKRGVLLFLSVTTEGRNAATRDLSMIVSKFVASLYLTTLLDLST